MVKDNKLDNIKFKGYWNGSLELEDDMVSYTTDKIDLDIPLQSIQSILYIKQNKRDYKELIGFTVASFIIFVTMVAILVFSELTVYEYVFTVGWWFASYVAFGVSFIYSGYTISKNYIYIINCLTKYA